MRLCLCFLTAAVLIGCDDAGVRRYRVPRAEAAPPGASQEGAAQRMLAAMIPHDARTWFFKVSGPAQAIAPVEGPFDRFVRSVRFPGTTADEIAWTVPEGWRRQAGSGLRYATFLVGEKDHPLEVTVIPLEGENASVLTNVNRWRGQLGLDPIGPAALAAITTEIEIDGARAIRVDMSGPGGSGKPATPALPPDHGQATTAEPIRYESPAGWEKLAEPGPMRLVAFRVAEGERAAEVSITPLPGMAGGLLPNVNRWRGQVGLGPITEDDLARDAGTIEVAGQAARIVDLAGPEERIVVVVLERGDQTWFFKLRGPADLAGKQKPAFEAFVRSVKFAGGEEKR